MSTHTLGLPINSTHKDFGPQARSDPDTLTRASRRCESLNLAKMYKLRPRFDRLRDRGLLTQREAATRLKIRELTLVAWANAGIIARYAYEAQAYLYDMASKLPAKHSSRWD